MSPLNQTKVLIAGNVYTLSGDESEEYIQRVALYINNKFDEIKSSENAKHLNTRLLSVLLEINIADDYFKAKETIFKLEDTIGKKEDQIAHIEAENIHLQKKMDQMRRQEDTIKAQMNGLEQTIERYKQELNEYIEMFDSRQ